MTPRRSMGGPRSTIVRAVATLLAATSLAILCSGVPVAHAADLQPGFPRVGIWWPDCASQSTTDLARCDWIALQNHDSGRIAALRAKNLGIVILGSTSARELNYVVGQYNNARNVELRTASTDWMLTQIGSTLTADITASTTSIPVKDTSRFEVGEMVLVDRELLHVVSKGASSLTVSARPTVTPAAPHADGTRIASVVSHWPGSITMDLTANCPKVDVGDGFGPETWTDWDVRRGRAVLDAAPWDGLLVDTLESYLSWMVENGDIRSIDPLRTNRSVGDDYKAFDEAWAQGAGAYGTALRAAVGDRLLVGNGNLRNFALNGAIFEQFPDTDFALNRWTYVFVGPYPADCPHAASYPEWCAGSAAPNLTLIQTYGSPSNYKLLRYGLCSALLADGYFSYALSSSGHAVNGIDHFDEYDNAGAGSGYLGQPTGGAAPAGKGLWRRDFDNGISVVNPTTAAATISLHGTFRKIKGKQDLKVNDGTAVTAVTIPARDGVILLRMPTLQASSTAVACGRETTLQAKVAAASTGVQIEQRTAGSTTWAAIATMTPDAAGSAQLVRAPTVTTEYRAVALGTHAVSNTVKVGVRPVATIAANRISVRSGGRIVLSGTITYPGSLPVTLQRLLHGKWKTVRRLKTSVNGRYSTTVRVVVRGDRGYRVHVAAAVRHLATTSGTIHIKVR